MIKTIIFFSSILIFQISIATEVRNPSTDENNEIACAAQFKTYSNAVLESSMKREDQTLYDQISFELAKIAFETCLANDMEAEKVLEDTTEGIED